jgi:hypothetical protein
MPDETTGRVAPRIGVAKSEAAEITDYQAIERGA